MLAGWLRESGGSCVVHAGAGLSTAAGIRDFRGKTGVWTSLLASQGNAPNEPKLEVKVKPFDEAEPTRSHLILRELCRRRLVRHIVSQNVDGLFLRSNLERRFISELHGNFYLDECTRCRGRFIRPTVSATMCLKKSTNRCPRPAGPDTSGCKGYLRDTILDWESSIPYNELRVAQRECKQSQLHVCIGTSLQLSPSKDLVAKQKGGTKKLVIINLQPTKFDQYADLLIHYYADDVMSRVAHVLDIDIPPYDATEDPTKKPETIGSMWLKK